MESAIWRATLQTTSIHFWMTFQVAGPLSRMHVVSFCLQAELGAEVKEAWTFEGQTVDSTAKHNRQS